MKEALDAQDGLYTLVVKHGDGTLEPRVIGSIIEYLFAPDDPEAVIEKMADRATRIVSLTVTEGGYNLDHVTGEFDARRPGRAHDLEPGAPPKTDVRARHRGAAAPARARARAVHGDVLRQPAGQRHARRQVFTAFARLRDPELGDWIEREVRFPNGMVDRITPATTDDDREEVHERFGVEDRWPVVCEPFTQWVLEDSFSAGRPPYEDAGVQVVDDVEPYELMKLRLLNASHQALAYFGTCAATGSCTTPRRTRCSRTPARLHGRGGDADARAGAGRRPRRVQADADRALLQPRRARHDPAAVRGELGPHPKWLLPVVRAQLESGGEITRSAAIVASWARYAEGVDEQGEPIEVVDRRADRLTEIAQRQREDPDAFIANRDLFGDLADDERFAEAYRSALRSLHERGARATLAALNA